MLVPVTIATVFCNLGDTDKQGVLRVRGRFTDLERSYSKPKSKNTEFMMEVEAVSFVCSLAMCECVDAYQCLLSSEEAAGDLKK